MSGRQVHSRAGAFDGIADTYERGRPGWPEAAVDAIVARLRLSRASSVLDLAAGTGKLTRMLAPRFASVTAVEPLAGMRAVLERAVPGARVLTGTAEAIPLEDDSVDAVFVAEAFHWFEPARAIAEIERVLRAGGGVAVLYNRLDWRVSESVWQRELHAVFEAHRMPEDDVDPFDTAPWSQALAARFGPLAEAAFDNVQRVDADRIEAMYGSFSAIAGLPPDHRTAAIAAVRAVLDSHEVRAAELTYRTVVVTATSPRRPGIVGACL